jgi:hypothetical protein
VPQDNEAAPVIPCFQVRPVSHRRDLTAFISFYFLGVDKRGLSATNAIISDFQAVFLAIPVRSRGRG